MNSADDSVYAPMIELFDRQTHLLYGELGLFAFIVSCVLYLISRHKALIDALVACNDVDDIQICRRRIDLITYSINLPMFVAFFYTMCEWDGLVLDGKCMCALESYSRCCV